MRLCLHICELSAPAAVACSFTALPGADRAARVSFLPATTRHQDSPASDSDAESQRSRVAQPSAHTWKSLLRSHGSAEDGRSSRSSIASSIASLRPRGTSLVMSFATAVRQAKRMRLAVAKRQANRFLRCERQVRQRSPLPLVAGVSTDRKHFCCPLSLLACAPERSFVRSAP